MARLPTGKLASRALNILDELQKVLNNQAQIGIGHNRPPESIEGEQLKEVRLATIELKIEFAKPEPSIPTVKTGGNKILKALVACGAAVGLGMLSGIGKTIGEEYLANSVIHYLHTAYNEIFHWLQVAAQFPSYTFCPTRGNGRGIVPFG
jgi:hypothetical protein